MQHSRGGKVGKKVHSQRVLGQRIAVFCVEWTCVIRDRQAGFTESCPKDQDGPIRSHLRVFWRAIGSREFTSLAVKEKHTAWVADGSHLGPGKHLVQR